MSAPQVPERHPDAPALNSLDEIEAGASVTVHFWLEQAQRSAAELLGNDRAAISSMVTASALYYLAERIVDACELIAKAMQANRAGGVK
jgi:hypothetical protein